MSEKQADAEPGPAPGAAPTLRVLIKTQDLVLLTLGVVIGSGIFLVPGLVLQQSGNVVWLAALVWLIGGGLSVLGALSYAELGALRPSAGGLYVYIREIFGERAAFLFGWSMFFIIGSGAVATLAVAFATYAGELVNLSATAGKVLSVLLIAVIALVNVLGTHSSLRFQSWTTWGKLLGLFVLAGTLTVLAHPPATSGAAPLLAASSGAFSGLALALVSALWAYEGWQWTTFAASEVVKPQSTLPKGLLLGTLVLVAVYLSANFAYLRALGPERLGTSTRVAADALDAVGLPQLARFVAVLIMISIASAANGTLMTSSRVYFAMAGDGLFFRAFARLSPKRRVPATAIVVSACWASVMALTGTFQQLLSWVVTIGWGFYALSAACLFGYRWRYPDAPSPYRVPGYPWTPLIFILGAGGVVVMAALREPRAALMGVLFLLAGLLVDAVRRARTNKLGGNAV
jgi:basic amino acid/polyamine antiporter, APA family